MRSMDVDSQSDGVNSEFVLMQFEIKCCIAIK